eukprot:5239250-Pyramimonas_sp.AAC.1
MPTGGVLLPVATYTAVGLDTAIKPLLSHSATGEFNSPPDHADLVTHGWCRGPLIIIIIIIIIYYYCRWLVQVWLVQPLWARADVPLQYFGWAWAALNLSYAPARGL